MTRWNEVCILIGREYYVDDEGVQRWKETKKTVFCNSYTLSTQAWSTARLADYTADDEIQIRTCDYSSQPDVIYRNLEYTVERVMNQGDFTRLILKRKRSDSGGRDAE